MALSDFAGANRFDDWTADLDRRWPERHSLAATLVEKICQIADSLPGRVIRVAELGVGNGFVATAIAQGCPLDYTGVDRESSLLEHVRTKLSPLAVATTMVDADLTSDAWLAGIGNFDVVFSLQSLHDVGGQVELERIYRLCRGLLKPGGILLNADFIQPQRHDDPDNPRRFPVDKHLRFLEDAGFVQSACMSKKGQMAIVVGQVAHLGD